METIGRSQVAVIVESWEEWTYILVVLVRDGREEKGKDTHYEGHIETACKCNYYVNPPQSPCLFKVRLGLGFYSVRRPTSLTAPSPQAGTQTNTIILMMVARPIGKVPMKSDWAGCLIMAHHISGKTVYRTMEITVKVTNSAIFRQNTTTEIQYSQSPL